MKLNLPVALMLICVIFVLPAGAQTLPIDTAFSTSFDFVDKKSDPLGLFIYTGPATDPKFVFEYTDGRKVFTPYGYGSTVPFSKKQSVTYYPDGTIYTKDGFVSMIRYPDGTVFLGKDEFYRQRYGFQFAPDGSYMAGSFWYRQPWAALMYVTLHYSADHQRISEGYHLKYGDNEMDLPTFINAYRKTVDPKSISPYQNISWGQKKYKGGWIKSRIGIGYRGNKDDYAIGFFRQATTGTDGRYDVWQGTIFDRKYTLVSFIEPGDTLSVTTPDINFPSNMTGVIRSRIANGRQFVSTGAPYALMDGVNIAAYSFDNGDFYTGWAKNGQINGYGIYKFKDGREYFGYWQNGQRNGWGTERFADGSYFKGAWANNVRNGPGRFYNADGSIKQAGLFVNDKLTTPQTVSLGYYDLIDEFPGVQKPPVATEMVTSKKLNGATYTGSIANDLPEGQGTLTMDGTGQIFDGKWHNGLPQGVMTITYPPTKDGANTHTDVYKGGVKDFRWEGFGHLVMGKFEMAGIFHNGVLNGYGMRRLDNGIAESGIFVNNVKEGRFEVTNAANDNLGYYTYLHGVRTGPAYIIFPEQGQEADGELLNEKPNGKWTYYARNMHNEGGKMVSSPTRIGYVTYNNGVQVSSQQDAVEKPDFSYKPQRDETPMCSYCSGTGTVNSGKTFMGREIPARCPRWGGTGRTWLNPKN